MGDYGLRSGYVLATADFTNPEPADARFRARRSHRRGVERRRALRRRRECICRPSGYYYAPTSTTPLQIFDLSNAAAPKLAGQTQIPGSVWLIIPSGNQLFALGNDYSSTPTTAPHASRSSTSTSPTPTAPTLIGTSSFGDGLGVDAGGGDVQGVHEGPDDGPDRASSCSRSAAGARPSRGYNNGVQLIEYTPTSITTAGAAQTKGWVERGIFVNGRIVSLSDLALSVVDYNDPLAPTRHGELTLARNVIAAQPSGATIAEVSTDWWGNDDTKSEVRVLPIADAAENLDESAAPSLTVPG